VCVSVRVYIAQSSGERGYNKRKEHKEENRGDTREKPWREQTMRLKAKGEVVERIGAKAMESVESTEERAEPQGAQRGEHRRGNGKRTRETRGERRDAIDKGCQKPEGPRFHTRIEHTRKTWVLFSLLLKALQNIGMLYRHITECCVMFLIEHLCTSVLYDSRASVSKT
jgi:hypothetical protein